MGKNEFPVVGRTVVVTGASQGMGLQVARQLAEKGANVVVVARNLEKLQKAIDYVAQGAANTQTQRFHHISADLTSSSECVRVLQEVQTWNSDCPPDIVWCCAGTSQPALFIDTPASTFRNQMDSNYFTSLYMAHATLNCWLRRPEVVPSDDSAVSTGGPPVPARHVIFTASILALYSFTGYSMYSPAKAALRSLSDTLSQELNIYAAAHPREPRVRVHTAFPATIYSEGYVQESLMKPDVTKLLEEGDEGQTPSAIASKCILELERGQEIITTDFLTALVKRSMLGGSIRGGFVRGFIDWLLAGLLAIVMVFVRADMDKKVSAWGRKYGSSGFKRMENNKPQD